MSRLARGSVPAILAVLAWQPISAGSASAQSTSLWPTQLGAETLGGAAPYGNPISDDRTYVHGFVNQLEGRIGSGSYFRWDGQAWIGDQQRPCHTQRFAAFGQFRDAAGAEPDTGRIIPVAAEGRHVVEILMLND